MIIGVVLGVLAGFYESMRITYMEKIFLIILIALALGSLSAWVARQPIQALLFGGLGAVSVIFENFQKGKS